MMRTAKDLSPAPTKPLLRLRLTGMHSRGFSSVNSNNTQTYKFNLRNPDFLRSRSIDDIDVISRLLEAHTIV